MEMFLRLLFLRLLRYIIKNQRTTYFIFWNHYQLIETLIFWRIDYKLFDVIVEIINFKETNII